MLQRPATAGAAEAIELRASAALHRALALAPTDALHGNELGVFLHTAGRHPEAVLRFEAAIANDPQESQPLLRHNFAHSLLMNRKDDASFLDREEEAASFLHRAMELMPDHADSHRLLSGLRVDEMRWQEAAVLARRAVALKPADIDAHNALATALAGPDAGNDWRGRGAGEHAEEAMHHFRRGLQLEAGEESEPASLVLQTLHNESALESDGTFVQFFGARGGQGLAPRARPGTLFEGAVGAAAATAAAAAAAAAAAHRRARASRHAGGCVGRPLRRLPSRLLDRAPLRARRRPPTARAAAARSCALTVDR